MSAPWIRLAPSAPVDGAALLDEVRAFVGRFVAFPTEAAATAVALWIAHTHLYERLDSTPRLALLSPEPGSGKTRTLEVAELLVANPMHVLSASTAAVFRTIRDDPPALLLDEVDAVFRPRGKDDGSEDLRALLNAGHRQGATIPRCVGPTHSVERFPVFCPVALAGLGDLPDTLMSRSVIVRMRRRAPGERVEPFRHREHAPEGEDLRARLADWAATVAEKVAGAWPVMPDGVTDRPADVWEPLLAVADAAGGHWPDTARGACTELVKVAETGEASLGVRLLGDLRTVFATAGDPDGMFTATILAGLHDLDEAPWSDLRGKPLDARGLARLLNAYGVRSGTVRAGPDTAKGYQRGDLWDVWQRYCPTPTEHDPAEDDSTEGDPETVPTESGRSAPGGPPPPEGPSQGSQPEQRRSEAPSGVTDAERVTSHDAEASHADPPVTCSVPLVTDVTDLRGEGSRDRFGNPRCDPCGRSLLTRESRAAGRCVTCRDLPAAGGAS